MASAMEGLRKTTEKAQATAEAVAQGNMDPAVIVSLLQAKTEFAANAKVMNVAGDMTRKLLDVLA
ncbi:Flagellar basal-body/hook protein C-terminal domain-containing protein [uncultured Gammaproteobacteria bacterium]